MRFPKPTTLLTAALTLLPTTLAFYLPGVQPNDYMESDSVPVTVNPLTSSESLLPYDYYFERFHFCEPKEKESAGRESLGAILFGDRLFRSDFEFLFMRNESCKQLCADQHIPAKDAKFLIERIKEQYQQNWFVDNFPVAERRIYEETGQIFLTIGHDLGFVHKIDQKAYMNNHFDFTISYHHNEETDLYRVVGAVVEPRSVKKGYKALNCPNTEASWGFTLDDSKENVIDYTYSVSWVQSDTKWATRWDAYLQVVNPQIHWFSIINSIVIIFMLTGMVGMILLRALHKDISRYNQFGDEDGGQEDFGWKLVHADVFRPPNHRMLLSVLLGNGAQLLMMAGVTLVFAVLGFLSPSSRGALTTVMIMFYLLFAGVAGYVSARVYKMLQGEYWKRNMFMTATLIPGILFLIFIILNFFLVGAHSSAAVPFGSIVALLALWLVLSLPTCLVGAYLGFRAPAVEHPVKTNQIPRQIPPQPAYLNRWTSALVGGLLPFGAIFIELFFIMNSIWAGRDYNWSWRSFMTAATSGLYVFAYSVVFYVKELHIDNVPSAILYFGWSLVISLLFSILTGTVGYFSTLIFVRKIFASIKVD
ncbi:hypothetical protein HDV00_006059 [Rhizophlyctis rosea]|nr:hypothetical protein HDV00_006059 [Rhizophlyctis rosea]